MRNKIKEVNFNLFAEINKTKKLGIFDFIPAETMDLLYKSMYGERYVSNLFADNDITDIADFIIGLYAFRWDNILSFITSSIPVLENYGEKLVETIKDNGTDDNTRTTTDKVSAFNDEDFTNDTNNTDTFKGKTQNVRERTQLIEKINPIELKNSIEYLKNNFIYDIVFVDVNNVLTLSIFDVNN
jgi:hypothetical protein